MSAVLKRAARILVCAQDTQHHAFARNTQETPDLYWYVNCVSGKENCMRSDILLLQDRGGTFTDCVASVPGKEDIVIKLLSVDPENYKDAPSEAIRRVLEIATGKKFPKGKKISLADVGKSDRVFAMLRTEG